MASTWREVRVFISSTFRDMHAERDHLVKVVFPALRERLLSYRIHLVDIDLRWGVTSEQANNDQALDLCLQQIDQCRPLFVGLLGQRYGWVPEEYPDEAVTKYGWIQHETGKSITELEILYGVLRNEKMRGRAFFCFRDPAFLGDLPSERQLHDCAEFPTEKEANKLSPREARTRALDRRRKLDALKDAIREAEPPVALYTDYRCQYQGLKINWRIAQQKLGEADRKTLHEIALDGIVDPREYASLSDELQAFVDAESVVYLDGLKSFGERVGEQLWTAIQAEYGLPETPPAQTLAKTEPLAEEADYHERFMESRLRVYVGRDKMQRALTKFANAEHTVPCLVTGPSGVGKSAALAKFVTTYRESHPEVMVIPHFVGASPHSTDLRQTLRRFCLILQNEFGFEEEVPLELSKLTTLFRNFLMRVPDNRRVLFAIDALNQLDETDNAHALNWLPHEWPAHVKLITSCIDDPDRSEAVLEVFQKRKRGHFNVSPLTNEERFEIVQRVPSLSAKSLDGKQIQLLLSNPATTNPLFLLVALEELRGFGSFEELNDRIKHFPRDGDTVTELFAQVLERLEIEFGEKLVRSLFQLLASARRGLSEPELQSLIEAEQQSENLFPVLRQVRAYLQPRGELLDFFHRGLYKAVRSQYLATETEQLTAHYRLASYFHRRLNPQDAEPWSGDSPRALSELPYHQTEGKLWNDLESTLSDLRFIEAKCVCDLAYDVVRDFTLTALRAPESVVGNTSPFQKFVDEHVSLLHAEPSQTLVYAFNSPDDLIAKSAESLAEHAQAFHRPWLRRVNRRQTPDRTPHSRILHGQKGSITACCFSTDGEMFLSASSDGSIKLWETETGRELRNVGCQVSDIDVNLAVCSCDLSPNNQQIVSTHANGVLTLWDADSGALLDTCKHEDGHFRSARFAPDSNKIAAYTSTHATRSVGPIVGQGFISGQTSAVIYDIQNDSLKLKLSWPIGSLPVATPGSSLGFTSSGEHLLTLEGSRVVERETKFGIQKRQFSDANANLRFLSVAAEADRCAAMDDDGVVAIWDMSAVALLLKLPDQRAITCAISPNGKFVAASFADGTVKVWNINTNTHIATLHGASPVTAFSFDASTGDLVCGCRNGSLVVRKMSEILKSGGSGNNDFAHRVSICELSSNGDLIAVSSPENSVQIRDWESNTTLQTFHHNHHSINACKFSQDARLLICASDDSTVSLWDMREASRVGCFEGHTAKVVDCAFSQDDMLMVSTSLDKTACIWDVSSRRLIRTIELKRPPCKCAFLADGAHIVLVHRDYFLQAFSTDTGTEIQVSKQVGCKVGTPVIAVSPDGTTVLSVTWLGFLSLIARHPPDWNTARRICSNARGYNNCSFLPDGKHALVAVDGTRIEVWNTVTAECRVSYHVGSFSAISSCTKEGEFAVAHAENNIAVYRIEQLTSK